MSIYQELQLNQAGSKALIRNSKDSREKRRHLLIYVFKVFLTLAFCMAFVTAYTKIFGEDNSVAGVVVLLTVMVFRSAIWESKPLTVWGLLSFCLPFWPWGRG